MTKPVQIDELRVELLAPAANFDVGCAAIDAGADALYIGAERFSARSAAGNSIGDIERLCNYARPFGVKVFLALNTLFKNDEEVKSAKELALKAIEAGVCAIIFQDVRVLDMELPIELHASTQTFIENPQRAAKFEQAGVSRLVVERGFSLKQIREIASSVDVEIEAFVHGAICVGYSGVCGLSEHLTGRSGNRGECAQPCRSTYDLVDSSGVVLVRNEALLSPRDLNLSNRIAELIEAGVCSLKIEGRLKEKEYVSNTVAYYNQILNQLGVKRTSWGVSKPSFEPNTLLTFNRNYTEWFLDGVGENEREKNGKIVLRSVTSGAPGGEYIGVVERNDKNSITVVLEKNIKLQNGDGLCFYNEQQKIEGVRINRVDENRIALFTPKDIKSGTKLYRNFSAEFKPEAERRINTYILFTESEDEYKVEASTDLDAKAEVIIEKIGVELAQNREKAQSSLQNGLSKSGGTIFRVIEARIECQTLPFLPSSAVNSLRRELLEKLENECSALAEKSRITDRKTSSDGIHNLTPNYLMRSKFCVLRERGLCLQYTKLNLPLRLVNNGQSITLKFDCTRCEMLLVK